MVPALIPALSPKDLVIAKPGICTSFIQTLSGPKICPLSFVWASTLPPNFIILCFSSYRHGFWSSESGITFQFSSPTSEARMALESPILNEYIVYLYTKTAITVDPLNYVLISEFKSPSLVLARHSSNINSICYG